MSLCGAPVPIVLDRLIRIRVADLPEIVLNEILSHGAHEDPTWLKEKVRGLQVDEDAHFLYSYRFSKDLEWVLLSRGLMQKVYATLAKYGIAADVTDNRVEFMPLRVGFREGVDLFAYQRSAVDDLCSRTEGILVSPPGSGKTVMGCGIIERLKQPTLIIVTTTEIMDQWITSINTFLTIGSTQVGKIGGGGKHKWKPITVATFQSLNNFTKEDWERVNETFGTIIGDESHHGSCDSLLGIFNNSKAKNRFGVTATINRKDGREFMVYDLISPRIVRVEDEALEAEGRSMKPAVEFVPITAPVATSYIPLQGNKGNVVFDMNWPRLYSTLAGDKERNAVILDNVVRTVRMGHVVLVLSARVEHCQDLFDCLKETDLTAGLLVGRVLKEERKQILKQAKAGNVDVLLATHGLAAEGLDVPRISCVHLTMPTTNAIFLKQASGRTSRVFEGKIDPLVIDYVDLENGMLVGMARSREKTYSKFGYPVRNTVKGLVTMYTITTAPDQTKLEEK